jgi:hypothetical protein
MVSLIADRGIHQMLRAQRGLAALLTDSGEVVAAGNLQTVWNPAGVAPRPVICTIAGSMRSPRLNRSLPISRPDRNRSVHPGNKSGLPGTAFACFLTALASSGGRAGWLRFELRQEISAADVEYLSSARSHGKLRGGVAAAAGSSIGQIQCMVHSGKGRAYVSLGARGLSLLIGVDGRGRRRGFGARRRSKPGADCESECGQCNDRKNEHRPLRRLGRRHRWPRGWARRRDCGHLHDRLIVSSASTEALVAGCRSGSP